jgi:hypothetical protein
MELSENLSNRMKPTLSLIDLRNIKATKTTDFLLPLLGYTKRFYHPYLINAYLGDVNMKYFDPYKLYVVISNHNMQSQHMRIENGIKEMEGFIDYYDVLDSKMSVFVVEIPEKFKEDYELFLDGKYSKLSEDAKIKILQGRSPKSAIPKIFNKDDSLKKHWEEKIKVTLPSGMEVWPILRINHELFNQTKFLKNNSN